MATEIEQQLAEARDIHRAGQMTEARRRYEALLSDNPVFAPALHLLGLLELQEGNLDAAEQRIRQALERSPEEAPYLNALGKVFFIGGRHADAAQYFAQAAAIDPNDPLLAYDTGTAELYGGNWHGALTWLTKAAELGGSGWELHANLGLANLRMRHHPEAIEHYRRALEDEPNRAELWASMASALVQASRLDEANDALNKTLGIDPGFAPAYFNRSAIRMASADIPGAIQDLDQAVRSDPDFGDAMQRRLYYMQFLPELEPETLYGAHRDWGDWMTKSNPAPKPAGAPTIGKKPLKVGLVSADLGYHSVGFFVEPLLAAHDRDRVKITCYSGLHIPDAMTVRLETLADEWRQTSYLNDDQLDRLIRADGIDILVDLSGHTNGNRLPVFARRPAPLQMTYLGYPGTTGLPAIDYRISDEWADPPSVDHRSAEQVIRLEGGFHCFAAPEDDVPVAPLPAARNGFVTFGSFNNLAKVNQRVIESWAGILAGVRGSRLLLKDSRLKQAPVRRTITTMFGDLGVSADRLDLRRDTTDRSDHLAQYGEIDIALDPFPYNGTTTTCEAMWMGVPVITLIGEGHAARVGYSLLSQMKMPDWIGESVASYGAAAVRHAEDLDALAQLRAGLRERMNRSPLRDASRLAGRLEDSYEWAWSRLGTD